MGYLELSDDDLKSDDKGVCVKCYRTAERVLKLDTDINKIKLNRKAPRSRTLATLLVHIPSPRKRQIKNG